MKSRLTLILTLLITLSSERTALPQLSPGALSAPHTQLEGISNCTQCHIIGNKTSNEKCLVCHTEIRQRIDNRKGYHSSQEVSSKECFTCHREHNGKDFRLIRLDIKNFDHNLTGYPLSVPHSRQECGICHNTARITDLTVRSKKSTYLGLGTNCLNCHEDYHQQTLSTSCLNCHNPEYFRPAPAFDHSSARFKLQGKHKKVDCISCHKFEVVNGKKFQEFRGVVFTGCASCHKDPHMNKFGQNCSQCHSEESFLAVKSVSNFDHNTTNFPLEGRHTGLTCKECHKTKLTDPLKYDRCSDCHSDYHGGQFTNTGTTPDCSHCHSVNGFASFSFTVEQHNLGSFPLKGSHEAVACYECHRKQEKWSFRNIGITCSDCHPDIHKDLIPSKYYPDRNCINCHGETRWTSISFDHSATGFPLTGAHAGKECRVCHFRADPEGNIQQKFAGLPDLCSDCHSDNHYGQFVVNGITDCTRCHETKSWKASLFDHDKSAFRLDGKHIKVPCTGCHKPQKEGSGTYINYKIKDSRCESCH